MFLRVWTQWGDVDRWRYIVTARGMDLGLSAPPPKKNVAYSPHRETDWSRIRVPINPTVSNCDRFSGQNL